MSSQSKTNHETDAAAVAEWVYQQTGESLPVSQYAESLTTAEAIITACRVPVLIPDLWPVSGLELLYLPPDGVQPGPAIAANFSGQVDRAVLRAIGRAVRHAFDAPACDCDMLSFELDSGATVYVFLAEVRDTVVEAAGVTLLSE